MAVGSDNRSTGSGDLGDLPTPLTRLLGREQDVAQVIDLLTSTRLLTLTGSGGAGKTRLALAAARALAPSFDDGAAWVDLAPLADPALVPLALATAVGIRDAPDRPLLDRLLDGLRDRRRLLVLDNAEHLVDAVARLVEPLLAGCPRLTLLVTSREVLAIPAEVAWRVPSLALPTTGDRPPLDELASVPAVALFLDRARAAQPGFVLTEQNIPAVVEICRRLDGLPLAIELAAARAPVLPPAQIAARLDDRFRLLTGGSRTALPRQQTLRATLDWSYELLVEAERAVLRRLAVFPAGCSLAAAEAACAAPGDAAADVLDLLARLVNKSLVQVDAGGEGEARYRLLETVRQYAWARLVEGGEDEATRARHCGWCLALGEAAEPGLRGPDQARWLDRLEQEHENLRAALRWAGERADVETVLRLGGAIYRFWWFRGYVSEGRAWLTRALAGGLGSVVGDAPRVRRARAKALHGAAVLARAQGDLATSGALFAESLPIWQELGERWHEANAYHNLGAVATAQADFAAARTLTEAGLAIWREMNDDVGPAWAVANLGQLAALDGDYEAARSLLDESLALYRRGGRTQPSSARALAVEWLGIVAFQQADYAAALTHLRESLAILAGLREQYYAADVVDWIAAVAVAQGQPARGLRLAGAAAVLREAHGTVEVVARSWIAAERDRRLAAARQALDDGVAGAAWAAGRALSLEEAVTEALGEVAETAALQPPPDPARLPVVHDLTPREVEVLRLLAQGATDRAIAADLSISVKTVHKHVASILGKTGSPNRTAAAAFAMQHRLT
jgi:non-specific serine/threonine protein kinase